MLRLLFNYLLGKLGGALFSLAAIILLTHSLAPAEYGRGMLVTSSFWLLFCLMQAGMGPSLMRFFYEPTYQNRIPILLYQCLFFVMMTSILVGVGLFLFRQELSQIFSYSPLTIWTFLMMGGILTSWLYFANLLPRFFEQTRLYAIGQTLNPFLYLMGVMIALFFEYRQGSIIIISQLIAMGITTLFLVSFYQKIWFPFKQKSKDHFKQNYPIPGLNEVKAHETETDAVDRESMRRSSVDVQRKDHFKPGIGTRWAEQLTLLTYGLPFMASYSLEWIFFNLDKFLLLRWSTYVELGIYTAAFMLSGILDGLRIIFINAWIPKCNQLLIHSPFKAKKIFHDVFEKTSFIFTLLVLFLLTIKSLLILCLGPSYRPAIDIVGWLLLSVYFFTLSDIVSAGILKTKKSYWNLVIAIFCLLINLLACFLMIPRLGAQGAALANAIGFGALFVARLFIAFRYYTFKIQYSKLLFYGLYLVTVILLPLSKLGLEVFLLVIFLIIASVLERHWLWPILGLLKIKGFK